MTKVTLINNTEEKKTLNKIDKIDQVHSGGTEQNWQDQTDKTIKNTHKKAKATHDMAQDTRHKTQEKQNPTRAQKQPNVS